MKNNTNCFTSFEKLVSYLVRFDAPIGPPERFAVDSSSTSVLRFKFLLINKRMLMKKQNKEKQQKRSFLYDNIPVLMDRHLRVVLYSILMLVLQVIVETWIDYFDQYDLHYYLMEKMVILKY